MAILENKESEPSEGRMKALALGIKMCALNAKLEESDYGDFFNDAEPGSTGSVPSKPARRPKLERSGGENGGGTAH